MLCVSALRTAASSIISMSPSKNVCCVRVKGPAASGSRYRFDPYACRVLASPVKSPLASSQSTVSSAAPMVVPRANRLLDILSTAAPAPTPNTFVCDTINQTSSSAQDSVPVSSSANIRYAFVRLKYDIMTYVAPFRVAVGDLVVVEGDRGENMGEVQEITAEKPSYPVPARILRKANTRDREQMEAKRLKEQNAVRTSQALADSLGLSLTIADTEFQFDYGKLTVYFRSKSRHTDFRKLQRGLFREFRCRIWLTEAYRHISPDPVTAKAA